MLMPKRTKYRKQQRGRRSGTAKGGSKVDFSQAVEIMKVSVSGARSSVDWETPPAKRMCGKKISGCSQMAQQGRGCAARLQRLLRRRSPLKLQAVQPLTKVSRTLT